MKRKLAVIAAVALTIAACGGDEAEPAAGADDAAAETEAVPSESEAAPEASGEPQTINMVVNPWSASRLNVEVAKIIIESELGHTVRSPRSTRTTRCSPAWPTARSTRCSRSGRLA
jgi:ABC-type proline/glycine betaine transport system substrate-binding protein